MDTLNPDAALRPDKAAAVGQPAPTPSPAPQDQGLKGAARRNLILLTCCQAVGQSCNTMMFAATGLSVITFYHRHDLANLPVTMQHIGVMIWVFPAALLMQRVGRRLGFRVGSLFGMAGAIDHVPSACTPRNFLAHVPAAAWCSATPSPACRCIASPPPNWCRCTTAPRRSPGSRPVASPPPSSARAWRASPTT